MKKSILFLLFFFSVICLSGNAASMPETSRDIKLQVERSNTPILKSTISSTIPIEASIEGTILSVSFLLDLNATIRITSLETGEVVYECAYSATPLSILPVSLDGEDLGKYKIEICYGDAVVYGEFVLC